jgi:predicted phage terminase large subunit-like protein
MEELKKKSSRLCGIFTSWDTGCKTGENNAYSACCVIAMTWENNKYKFYLIDVYRERFEMPELLKVAKDIYNGWRSNGRGERFAVKALIEDKASGTALIQLLNNNLDNDGRSFDIEAIKPDMDKISRLHAVSAYIENGDIMFPNNNPEWWYEFEKELLGFPNCKFKDQVDALTQCINYKLSFGMINPF